MAFLSPLQRMFSGAAKAEKAAAKRAGLKNRTTGLINEERSAKNDSRGLLPHEETASEKTRRLIEEDRAATRQRLEEERQQRRAQNQQTAVSKENAESSSEPSTPIQDLFKKARSEAKAGTPTANQAEAGAKNTSTAGSSPTGNQSKAGATKGDASAPTSESGEWNQSAFDAKMKALKKKGAANEAMGERISKEHGELVDLINAGEYNQAAEAMGMTGKYTEKDASMLMQKAHKNAMDGIEGDPSLMDYVRGHRVISTSAGIAIGAGTIAAINSSGGRKSNADLYSSPY